MTSERPTGAPSEATSVRIEVCEKHGLRYNAALDDGCARCRTEAEGRTMDRRGFSPQRAPDVTRSLLVAVALVVGIGGSLYLAHSVAFRFGKAVMEQVLEESPAASEEDYDDYEDDFDELFGDG